MYAMANTFANVYSNVNHVHMAGLMTAPMVVIELAVIRGMDHNRTWNAVIMKTPSRSGEANATRQKLIAMSRNVTRPAWSHC